MSYIVIDDLDLDMDKSLKEKWLHIAEFCYEIRGGGKTSEETEFSLKDWRGH